MYDSSMREGKQQTNQLMTGMTTPGKWTAVIRSNLGICAYPGERKSEKIWFFSKQKILPANKNNSGCVTIFGYACETQRLFFPSRRRTA